MSALGSIVKSLVLKHLPDCLLRRLKRAHYYRVLRTLRIEEIPHLLPVQDLLVQGEVAVDVGANIGLVTRFLADFVGPTGEIHCVEPVPETFEYLQNNAVKMGLTMVRLHNYAVSNRAGTAQMFIPPYESGGKNFYQAHLTTGPLKFPRGGTISINTNTLDTLLRDRTRPISFIKIDVEGAELECLLGAERILAHDKPSWLIEVCDDPDVVGSRASQLFELLARRQYDAYWFDGKHLRTRRPGERSVNYFFLLQSHCTKVSRWF